MIENLIARDINQTIGGTDPIKVGMIMGQGGQAEVNTGHLQESIEQIGIGLMTKRGPVTEAMRPFLEDLIPQKIQTSPVDREQQ